MAVATDIILYILSILTAVLGFFSKYLFDKVQDHEKRVQKMEDVHGNKFEALEKKIDRLEICIQNLADNLHKERNQEHNLTIAITKLYEHLEKVQHERHN